MRLVAKRLCLIMTERQVVHEALENLPSTTRYILKYLGTTRLGGPEQSCEDICIIKGNAD